MTSVSIVSLSLNAACGRMTGGGASIAAAPFFLLCAADLEKKEPKKLSSLFTSTSRSLLLLRAICRALGSFGLGGPGCLGPCSFSETNANAWQRALTASIPPVHDQTYLVATDKVWVSGVNIASLHPGDSLAKEMDRIEWHSRNHISYQFHGGVHGSLEEVDYHSVEAFAECGEPFKRLLQQKSGSQSR